MATSDKLSQLKNREQELLQKNQEVERKRKSIQEQVQQKRTTGSKTLIEAKTEKESDTAKKESNEGQLEEKRDLIDQIEEIKRKNEVDLLQKIARLKQISSEQEAEIQSNTQEIAEYEHQTNIQSERLLEVENNIRELEGKGKAISNESKEVIAQIQAITEKYEAAKTVLKDAKYRVEVAQREKSLMVKELEEQRESVSKVDQSSLKKEAKMQKIILDLENMKVELKEKSIVQREVSDEMKKQNEKLSVESKRLERQKQELIQAFKKQQKLIDLLNKQKTHLEIARSLNLTEEEYIKAVDLAEKL